MKGLNKLAVLVAIATQVSSVNALEVISDAELSSMTGQAGVTIELDTKVTMDAFTYTDPAGGSASGGSSSAVDQSGITIELDTAITLDSLTYTDTDTDGSIVLGGVVLGGGAVAGGPGGARLDNLKLMIDVTAEGHLSINHHAIDYVGMLDGTNGTDFGLHVDRLGLSGTNGNSTLISDINIAGVMGPGETVIFNDGSNGFIAGQGYGEIVDGSARIDVIGVGVSNLKIFQDDNPFSSATYIDKDGNSVAKWTDYNTDVMVDTTGDGNHDTSAAQYASDNGNNQWVFGAGRLGKATSADGTVSNALFLRTDSSVIDMSMNVGMGNGSLDNVGYFEIQNLNTSGTELIIYGH